MSRRCAPAKAGHAVLRERPVLLVVFPVVAERTPGFVTGPAELARYVLSSVTEDLLMNASRKATASLTAVKT